MKSKRMLMGAAVIGCVAATMMSGAYAQEAQTRGQFNERAGGQQPSTNAQPHTSMRQGQDTNAQFNTRSNGKRKFANGPLERRGFANSSTRESRSFVAERGMRVRRGAYLRISEQRYGRGWDGERGLYARAGVEGGYRGWRGERWAYRDRAVGAGVGVAAADSGYRTRHLYAYAPTYDVGYTAAPSYDYAPGYDVAVTTGPYYAPGWNVAYAGPYYDYAPGVSFGIGIGPVGIGFGPAWGW